LSAPVDVYSEWVDACDAVAKEDLRPGRRFGETEKNIDEFETGDSGDEQYDVGSRRPVEGIAADDDDY
jgi:transcription elongation factor Elf1